MLSRVSEEELIPLHIMRKAVNGFWKAISFQAGDKKVFSCQDCGDKPNTLVIDGVCIGIRLEHLEGEDIFTPYAENKPVLMSTKYQERQFVGPYENGRKKIKLALESCPPTYPKFGNKKSENNGLNETKNFLKILKEKHPSPPKPYLQLMKVLCSSSSTTSHFQPYEPEFCKKLMKHMHERDDIFTSELLSTSTKIKEMYPHFYELYENIWILEGHKMPMEVLDFFYKILNHVISVYEGAPIRTKDDYEEYEGEEIYGQFYPCFPLKYYRAKYEIDGKGEQWDEHCSKLWSEHAKFSPGLFLMLCACRKKKIYGFQKLSMKESPRLMFDFLQCRTDPDYKPTVLYDAACLFKEFSLNRETRTSMEALACSDSVHEANHTACLRSFMSSIHPLMKTKNSESAEQFNSLLRKISNSLVFMNLDNYLVAVKIFSGFYNLREI
jgi:hypothetical protein